MMNKWFSGDTTTIILRMIVVVILMMFIAGISELAMILLATILTIIFVVIVKGGLNYPLYLLIPIAIAECFVDEQFELNYNTLLNNLDKLTVSDTYYASGIRYYSNTRTYIIELKSYNLMERIFLFDIIFKLWKKMKNDELNKGDVIQDIIKFINSETKK